MSHQDGVREPVVAFEPLGFVLTRVPLLPIEVFHSVRGDVASGISDTAGWKRGVKAHVSAVDEAIKRLLAHSHVVEALEVASHDLEWCIKRMLEGAEGKRTDRARLTLLRYLTRMATRPVPFGLFAGVAAADLSHRTNLRVGQVSDHWTRTRPDMKWLLDLVVAAADDEGIARGSTYRPNPLLLRHSGRVIVPHVDQDGRARSNAGASVRDTKALRRVLDLASSGITLDELGAAFAAELDTARASRVPRFLRSLKEAGVLTSELKPPLTGSEPARYVLERLTEVPDCARFTDRLSTALSLCADYDQAPVGAGMDLYQDLRRLTAGESAETRTPVQVDLATKLESSELSASVGEECARAVELLFRTAPPFERPALEAYKRRFLERYGAEEVPLLEVLDEHLGLGPPDGFANPPSRRASPGPSHNAPLTSRDRILLELLHDTVRTHSVEVELTEEITRQLESAVLTGPRAAPFSVELFVRIAARSAEAVDNGDFCLVLGPSVGVSGAGKTFARFSDLLPGDVSAQFRRLFEEEARYEPDCLTAELVYLPLQSRWANVMVRPSLTEYELAFNTGFGVPPEGRLDFHDLVVGVTGARFYVRSVSQACEVVVRSNHLLHPVGAPNICRFLMEVSAERSDALSAFDWGAAEPAPFLPRVRCGRVVLRVAQWSLPRELGETASTTDSFAWQRAITDWRLNKTVPRYVYLTKADHRLLLDLEDPLCLDDLQLEARRAVEAGRPVVMTEMLPDFDHMWVTDAGGRRYATEFVVPLKRSSAVQSSSPALPRREKPSHLDVLRPPGSDWLYAKLYCAAEFQDDLLVDVAEGLVEDLCRTELIKGWFFIKYRDPDPHLRLRLAGHPTDLSGEVLQRLLRWAGPCLKSRMITRLTVDTYEREIQRYGGVRGMKLAESIFAADSEFVARAIASLRIHRKGLQKTELLMLSVDDLLRRLGLDSDDRTTLYRLVAEQALQSSPNMRHDLGESFRRDRKRFERVVGDSDWLTSQPGGSELTLILEGRGEALRSPAIEYRALFGAELSTSSRRFLEPVVHMQSNRVLGTDWPAETEVKYYLAKTYEGFRHHIPERISI